jgi:hypothetical protein
MNATKTLLGINKGKITTLITSALVVLAAQAQNLILNGSFESPALPINSQVITNPTYWTTIGAVWLKNGTACVSGGCPGPEDGQQYVDIGDNPANGPLMQTFTVSNSMSCVLNWYDSVGDSGGVNNNAYSVAIIGPSNQVLASGNFDAWTPTSQWTARSMNFNLTPGTYTLQFQAESYYGSLDTFIDNVSLVEICGVKSTPTITWANPAPILYGAALSSNQLDATANVAGSFAYNPTNGTVLNPGTNTLSVIFTPTDTNDYTSAADTVSLVVLAPQPSLNIQKAVYLTSTDLLVGLNYQVQASTDLINWTNQGSVFTATNSNWQCTNYWNVIDWNQLFFRLQASP